MVSDELHSLDATAQADLVRRGQVSAVELVDAAIARIEALNPDLNALTQERFASARKEAETAGREGAFPGVPILLKDLGCPALGLPEYQGSLTLKRRPPDADHDCAMVRRFKGAGFVVLGRTNVPEFGVVSDTRNAAFGATSNPWNRAHSRVGPQADPLRRWRLAWFHLPMGMTVGARFAFRRHTVD
jgi:amidase